jgi:hypothetical protein
MERQTDEGEHEMASLIFRLVTPCVSRRREARYIRSIRIKTSDVQESSANSTGSRTFNFGNGLEFPAT